jgi:putative addiction module component (TIGR02574 family)
MAPIPFSELRKLTVAERIQLAQDLWDSIAEDADALPVTAEQQAELDQRLADADQNPGDGSSWLDVKSRLLNGR